MVVKKKKLFSSSTTQSFTQNKYHIKINMNKKSHNENSPWFPTLVQFLLTFKIFLSSYTIVTPNYFSISSHINNKIKISLMCFEKTNMEKKNGNLKEVHIWWRYLPCQLRHIQTKQNIITEIKNFGILHNFKVVKYGRRNVKDTINSPNAQCFLTVIKFSETSNWLLAFNVERFQKRLTCYFF